ncbi:helix-turn-helix transcriptional regulator [Streptomyces sioyaensis]
MVSCVGRLAGRGAEMTEMERRAASAVAGEGQAAFVVGEAGLGKTAMVELAAAHARSVGMRTLCGAAQEWEQQRPFALISSCLQVDEASGEASRARVAEILRGGARYAVPGAADGSVEGDVATVEAMIALVEEVCAQGPLALFLDDLQWADSASLTVLDRLVQSVQQLPLLLVGAYRPVPPVGQLVRLSTCLAAGNNRTLLELAPLSRSAVSALLADLCGGAAGPRLRHLAEGAAGNPLYLTELVAAFQREQAIEVREGVAEVTVDGSTPSLTEVVAHRLRYLREETLRALRVASVLGGTCTAAELAAVLDMPMHDLLGLVAEAERAGVLRDAGGQLVFPHDLVRHALNDAVPNSVRAMLHTKAAQALAAAGVPPERVAEHLLHGTPTGEFLTTWLEGAAVQLTGRAPVMALRLLGRALAVADPGDPRTDHLHLHRATAQLSCGRLAEAEENARCVLARTRDPELECLARWIIVQATFARGRPDLALAEARAACTSGSLPAVELVRFQAFSAVCLFALGELAQAGTVAFSARSAADEYGDGPALANALHVLAAKRFLEAPDSEAVELARQACRLTPATIHPAQWIGLQLAMVNCYIDLDLTNDAQRALADVRSAAERTGGVFLPWYHLSCALLAFHSGRWDDALAEVEAGLAVGYDVAMSRVLRAVAALIAVHRGRQATADSHLPTDGAASDGATVAWFYEYLPLCASALADEAHGRSGDAYTRLADAFRHGTGHLPSQLILGFLTPDLVRLALAQGDRAQALRYALAARARADHSGSPYHLGDAQRCQGLLTKDPDLLVAAARCYHKAPRPLSEAHALTDAAELLARSRSAGQARRLLDQALEIYTRLDAHWDAGQALSRLRAAGVHPGTRGPRRSTRHGWGALTPTERIVAQHVAGGHSNPQIAHRMSISRRTVGTHVSHILGKLGMTSRVELAAAVARRQDIMHPPQD